MYRIQCRPRTILCNNKITKSKDDQNGCNKRQQLNIVSKHQSSRYKNMNTLSTQHRANERKASTEEKPNVTISNTIISRMCASIHNLVRRAHRRQAEILLCSQNCCIVMWIEMLLSYDQIISTTEIHFNNMRAMRTFCGREKNLCTRKIQERNKNRDRKRATSRNTHRTQNVIDISFKSTLLNLKIHWNLWHFISL